jgi:hypothetical protein
MWEAIQGILSSDSFWKAVAGIGCLVILLAILAKKGILSFDAFGLKIDNGEDNEREIERTVIRSQMLFVKSVISDFYDDIPNFEGRDEWRLKYVCERVISVFIDAITLNHITKENIYTEIKQKAVWAEIINNTQADVMTSEDFRQKVYTKTAEILEKLISIREYYKTEKK